ncbi:serine/threonine phosphatase [Pantanalinema rosaneae CENA516]|uniref:serine/threonine phosphatase n=1 Tax=Pantanalinema rosaneae TaxID=1620701 RepID=UPI003D6EDDAE
MLVCPQCQFENPVTNKFCQECGTSLTQNSCPKCGSLNPFNVVNCQECGAVSGVIWVAIVAASHHRAKAAPEVKVGALTVGDHSKSINDYLDEEQRYRLLEPLPWFEGETGEQQVKVLDCQPLQLSCLEMLMIEGQSASPNDSTNADSGELQASMMSWAIPTFAQPYLALGEQFYQAIPAIHDAWHYKDQDVVLLEDRSQFPLLIDLWQSSEMTPPVLQVLHWLYEMVELWQALSPWNCQQTLLDITNLRLDEDQALCLQQLHPNPAGMPRSIQDLGRLWQALFAESQKTQIDAITSLLADLDAGKITMAEEVRSRLEAIANQLEDNQPMPDLLEQEFDTFQLSDTETDEAEFVTASPASTPTRLELVLDEIDDLEEDGDLDSDEMPTVVLPMQLFTLEEIGRTDIGQQRDHNEDYFGIETQVSKLESPSGKTLHARNLYILCDGMGGHAGGEVASALAVDTLRRFFKEHWQHLPFPGVGSNKLPSVEVLSQAVQLANKAIYDVNQQNARSGSGRMGTTLVMVLIQDTEVAVAHVGDSRLYRYTRKRGLEQVTIDHEVGQREIQRGVDPEVAYARPDAYQLTQALGPRDEHFVKPDIQFFELSEDMLLLLCSDGLTDNELLETHAKTHIEPLLSSQANLDKGVSQLIELANQHNGHDNITAIAIRAKVRPCLSHLR